MASTIEILVGLVLILLASRFILGGRLAAPWVSNLTLAQTTLTIVAAVIAGFWYFFERPHAPKIRIEQAVSGIPLGGGRALVLAEVTITNAGASAIDLRHTRYQAYLQQVTPLPPAAASEIGAQASATALRINDGDNWGAIAKTRKMLPSFLEAGEVENLYYRVVIPCAPSLRVYFTSRIDKPPLFTDRFMKTSNLKWVKQTLLDLGPACAAPAPPPSPPPDHRQGAHP